MSISVCVIVRYKEFCEGCESKKIKIPITYARARDIMTKKRIAKGCKWRNVTNHDHEKMSEAPQKNLPRFLKNVGDFLNFVGDFLRNVGGFIYLSSV